MDLIELCAVKVELKHLKKAINYIYTSYIKNSLDLFQFSTPQLMLDMLHNDTCVIR